MNLAGFRCLACQQPVYFGWHGICSRCAKQALAGNYCGHCGSNLPENRLSCGNCLRNEPKWHRLVRVGHYQAPLNEWIYSYKLRGQFQWDLALARLLLLAVKQAQRRHQLALPEVILPVPLHWQRRLSRGYNQAERLASHLSHWLQLPLDQYSLQRVRPTASQRDLTATERRQNLKNAFVYQPIQTYRRVAIVDDVVTTGSTMNAICLELLKQKVQEIQVWTLGRT